MRMHDSVEVDKAVMIALDIIKHPYSWPGCYEKIAITDDGGCLCHDCVKKELRQIARSYKGDGWRVVGVDTTDSCEARVCCDHCGRTIVDSEEGED